MKSFLNIFYRELKRIFTSKDLLVICLLAPVVYSFGLAYIYDIKNPRDIKIAVVDKDDSAVSRNLIRMVNSTPELNVTGYYSSVHEAYKAIFKNSIYLFYFIPSDFTSNLKKGKSTFAFIGANASNFMISSSSIKTIVMTSQFLSAQISAKFLVSKGISKNIASAIIQPVKTDIKWMYNPSKTYAAFFIPFILFAVLQQIIIVAVCHTMSLETEEKTWINLFKMSGNKILPVLSGKGLPYVIVGFLITLFFVYGVYPFSDIMQFSKINLILLSLIYSAVVVFFAMLMSHLFTTPVKSLCALTFYSMPVLLISGFAWPLYMLPKYLLVSAYFFPSTYFINIFRYYSLNDIPLHYSFVSICQLSVMLVVCLLINIFVFKIKMKKYQL